MNLDDILRSTTKHIILHGRAGSGKSTLIRDFVDQHHADCLVMAPTGKTTQHIRGRTIASFLAVKKRRKKVSIIESFSYVIIDEISMVRAKELKEILILIQEADIIDNIKVRLILVGDPFQLPPVVTERDLIISSKLNKRPSSVDDFYFFQSTDFQLMLDFDQFSLYFLDTHYRQNEESQVFLKILDHVSEGYISDDELRILNGRVIPALNEGYKALKIPVMTTTRKDAEQINNVKINQSQFKVEYFESRILKTEHYRSEYQPDIDQCPLSHQIAVSIGIPVFFTKNDPMKRWYNGTQGIVIGIRAQDNGTPIIYIKLDSGWIVEVLRIDHEIVIPEWCDEERRIVYKTIASVNQFPIMAGYAFTIHKSQGLTLENMILALGFGTFAPGQMYVALSRTHSLNGIHLFSPIKREHIWCSDAVKHYWDIFISKAERIG